MNRTCTIVVCGKGGTGKTTISGLLVRSFLEAGARPVLAVDADPNANLHEALGVDLAETLGWMREEAFTRSIPPGMDRTSYIKYRFRKVLVEAEGFDLLAMGRPEGTGCYCFPNSLLGECMHLLGEDYPITVVDSEAGLEHISRGTVRRPDILLIVSDPGMRGLRTARRIRDLAVSLGLGKTPMYLVINRCKGEKAPAEDLSGEGLPLLAAIPEDAAVEDADLRGAPVAWVGEGSGALAAVRGLAAAVLDRCGR
ncbi:MAG: AAA family ATPase [Methanomicrobiaceae archaeon]|nr:AAA family ATPase [Methanomicrobiaceae archaeon]